MRLGDDRHLVEERADHGAVADNAVNPRFLALLTRLELRELLLEAVTLRDETLAVARHDTLELHGLADQVGDHGEEADIGVEPKHRPAVPDAVDGQRSHDA